MWAPYILIGYNPVIDMTAKTMLTQRLSVILRPLIAAALLSACLTGGSGLPNGTESSGEPESALAEPALFEPVEGSPTAPAAPAPAFTLPRDLTPITPENARSLRELASVYPFSPPYYHISDDGTRTATGNMQTVEIREAASGALLSAIPAALPDCDFGFDRYFRLNANGAFIALVNGKNIEVWQAGGGLIYSSAISSEFTSNTLACGADLPELALSPDGRLLVISGIAYTRTTSKRYFRVVDVRANEILYEWDGTKDSLYGRLYTYYGLGFSDDGLMLQTFDPTRFIRSKDDIHKSFRFWSVQNWQEVASADDTLTQHFSPGRLLFPWAEDGLIEVRSRLNGSTEDRIPMEGCLWDAPCETRFSADGGWAVVLERTSGQFLYRNDVLNSAFTVWDLAENQAVVRGSGALRDLESVLVKADGSLIRTDLAGSADTIDTETSGWWTFRDNFSGLQAGRDGRIFFSPLAAASGSSEVCQFCATCSIDAEAGAINCSNGIADTEGGRITLKTEGGQVTAMRQDGTGETLLGTLALPEMAEPAEARVRILGYSQAQQTLFYCADEAQRQAGCFIYDTSLNETLETPEDISFLRFSTNGLTATYFDRTDNALFLYDLSLKKLTRKSPYQSRSTPVNAVFSKNGTTFQYVIQYQNNASDLSVETLDSETWKSYGRTSLKKAGVVSPTAYLESEDGRLWMFAGRNGEVWLLSSDEGVLLHRFQAHQDDIIGMALAPEGTWLLTMGENGILKFWGIGE